MLVLHGQKEHMKNKKTTITIGIPTRCAGESLRRAVKSIYNSKGCEFKFIIVADSIPVPKDMLLEFKKLEVLVIENKTPGSQLKKVKLILSLTKTDIFIFTQDDVLFDKYALKKIVDKFEKDQTVTMIAPHIKSMPAETLLERILETGLDISYNIGISWNNANNYLLANGRCLAFRTEFLKKNFRIPENIINADSYLYFENKRFGGKFLHVRNAVVYNKNPMKLQEHLSQAHRFLISQGEVQKLFKNSLSKEYSIPPTIGIKALLKELVKHPILTILYLVVNMYSKFTLKSSKYGTQWQIATSTKR